MGVFGSWNLTIFVRIDDGTTIHRVLWVVAYWHSPNLCHFGPWSASSWSSSSHRLVFAERMKAIMLLLVCLLDEDGHVSLFCHDDPLVPKHENKLFQESMRNFCISCTRILVVENKGDASLSFFFFTAMLWGLQPVPYIHGLLANPRSSSHSVFVAISTTARKRQHPIENEWECTSTSSSSRKRRQKDRELSIGNELSTA